MIEVEHITKKFGDALILSDVSFLIPDGEIYGLIGYNGVGKTTLLKIISGIYRPDSGRVKIQGEDVYENAKIKQKSFFMTEEATFFSQSSLKQMRKFYSGYYPNWSDKTFEGLVKWFGVDPSMKISQFSKGMQRQASLTLAFSTRAKYLFLDEAFDGLDYTMRRQIRDMIQFYVKAENATILVSSHNLKELEDLADHIGMLSEGKLIFNDSTKQMRQNYQACQFVFEGERNVLEALDLELLEPDENVSLCEQEKRSHYFGIIHAGDREAYRILQEAGAKQIRLRPVQLEEFFRKERKEQEIDWKEIFE